jgi:hypothetical protein
LKDPVSIRLNNARNFIYTCSCYIYVKQEGIHGSSTR